MTSEELRDLVDSWNGRKKRELHPDELEPFLNADAREDDCVRALALVSLYDVRTLWPLVPPLMSAASAAVRGNAARTLACISQHDRRMLPAVYGGLSMDDPMVQVPLLDMLYNRGPGPAAARIRELATSTHAVVASHAKQVICRHASINDVAFVDDCLRNGDPWVSAEAECRRRKEGVGVRLDGIGALLGSGDENAIIRGLQLVSRIWRGDLLAELHPALEALTTNAMELIRDYARADLECRRRTAAEDPDASEGPRPLWP